MGVLKRSLRCCFSAGDSAISPGCCYRCLLCLVALTHLWFRGILNVANYDCWWMKGHQTVEAEKTKLPIFLILSLSPFLSSPLPPPSRTVRSMRSLTTSGMASALGIVRGEEQVVEIDGQLNTLPVLQHVGVTAWPGGWTEGGLVNW